MTCKTCEYFKRGTWHKAIDSHEGQRNGGTCEVLLRVLAIENSALWNKSQLAVQDTFGCTMYKEKRRRHTTMKKKR